jgi:hypothetical protein
VCDMIKVPVIENIEHTLIPSVTFCMTRVIVVSSTLA